MAGAVVAVGAVGDVGAVGAVAAVRSAVINSAECISGKGTAVYMEKEGVNK